MAYVSVIDWSVEQVTDWMKGLDATVARYITYFLNNGISGHQLLNLRVDDLDHLGVYLQGHQELILEAVELLRNFHYEIDKENVQVLALRLVCAAKSLYKDLQLIDIDAKKVPTQTMSDVHNIVSIVKSLVQWLDRSPFVTQNEYNSLSTQILQNCYLMVHHTHRDTFSDKPVASITNICDKLMKIGTSIVQELSDPMILQPATLDLATLKKKEQELGFHILASNTAVHQIAEITYGSPAQINSKIEVGDEIVQINYQTIVGWQRKNVLKLLQLSKPELVLTLKKRPRHTKIYGQIYMKPYRLPSKKRGSPYSRWNDNIPSPRLLSINDIPDIPPPPKPAVIAEVADISSASSSSDSDSEPSDIITLDNGGRLYPVKPRMLLQRRNTISGSSPSSARPSESITQFYHLLRKQTTSNNSSSVNIRPEKFIEDSVCIRDKSVSCSHGLEMRPTTVIGIANNKSFPRKNTFHNRIPRKVENILEKHDERSVKFVERKDSLKNKKDVTIGEKQTIIGGVGSKTVVGKSCYVNKIGKDVIVEDKRNETGNQHVSTLSLNSLTENIDFIDEGEDCTDRSKMSLIREKDSALEDVHVDNIIKKFDLKGKTGIAKPKVFPRSLIMNKTENVSLEQENENLDGKDGKSIDELVTKENIDILVSKNEDFFISNVENNSGESLVVAEALNLLSKNPEINDLLKDKPPEIPGKKPQILPRSITAKNRGKLDKSHSTPAYDLTGESTSNSNLEKAQIGNLEKTQNSTVEKTQDLLKYELGIPICEEPVIYNVEYPAKSIENEILGIKPIERVKSRALDNVPPKPPPRISTLHKSDIPKDIEAIVTINPPPVNEKNTPSINDKHSSSINEKNGSSINEKNASQINDKNASQINDKTVPQINDKNPLSINEEINTNILTSIDSSFNNYANCKYDASLHSNYGVLDTPDLIQVAPSLGDYDVFKFEAKAVSSPVGKSGKHGETSGKSGETSTGKNMTSGSHKSSTSNLVSMIYSSKGKSKKKNSLLAKRRNVSVSDVSPGEITGFLHQRLRNKQTQNVHWEKRWFVLNTNCLYGFKTKESARADCYIYLSGFTVTVANEVKSRTNAFKVYHTGTVFYFSSETTELLSAWIELISSATLSSDSLKLKEQIFYSETDDDSDNELKVPTTPTEKHDVMRKFNSLKKFTKKRTESSGNGNAISGSTSLDRKWFFNKTGSSNSSNSKSTVPVKTAQFRSYRKISTSTTTGNFTSHIPNFASRMEIQTLNAGGNQNNVSSPNLAADELSQAKTYQKIPNIHTSNPSLCSTNGSHNFNATIPPSKLKNRESESLEGFVTLKELMHRLQEERMLNPHFQKETPAPINPNLIRPDVVYGEVPIRDYPQNTHTHTRTSSDCSNITNTTNNSTTNNSATNYSTTTNSKTKIPVTVVPRLTRQESTNSNTSSSCFGKRSSSIKKSSNNTNTNSYYSSSSMGKNATTTNKPIVPTTVSKYGNNSLPRLLQPPNKSTLISDGSKNKYYDSCKSLEKKCSYEMIYCPQRTVTDVHFAQNRKVYTKELLDKDISRKEGITGWDEEDGKTGRLKSVGQYMPLTPDDKGKFHPTFAFELNLDERGNSSKENLTTTSSSRGGKLKQLFSRQDSRSKVTASPKLPRNAVVYPAGGAEPELSWNTNEKMYPENYLEKNYSLQEFSGKQLRNSPPTADYPGLEYPPVFEPETYSLADAQSSLTLLRKHN